MNLESILKELENDRVAIVAKKVGISQKKLSKVLKVAGYKYNRKSGWNFVGVGEPSLDSDIQEFMEDNENRQESVTDNALTKNEVNVLRKVINEWDATKTVVN
ncbi:hypothetical protein [Bacillus sp. C1]